VTAAEDRAVPRPDPDAQSAVWPLVVRYLLLRLLLTALLTAALLGVSALAHLGMPVLVAAMLAIVLQLPLAWLLLARQRDRVTAATAASASRRRRTREQLRAALAGGEQIDDDRR
jgi:hypothetical protein